MPPMNVTDEEKSFQIGITNFYCHLTTKSGNSVISIKQREFIFTIGSEFFFWLTFSQLFIQEASGYQKKLKYLERVKNRIDFLNFSS